ncbi:MAG: PSD1 and planctomycete cytochrome C domain-containing protein [Pirellulaceae bacterium]
MRRAIILLIAIAILAPSLAIAQDAEEFTREQIEFFELKIRPVLAAKCMECHGPDVQESGLRIDSRDLLLKGSEKYPVVVSGDPTASVLMTAIKQETDLQMPPDEKLTDAQINDFQMWIKMGMPWPDDQALSKLDGYASILADHWSLQPVKVSPLPSVSDLAWPRSNIDFYILNKLDAAKLRPSAEASRRELIRRVMFDVTGLAPTVSEVAAFESDDRPDAYERMVDRVLVTPQHGERWARYWMDVARYSDTLGYNFTRGRRFPYSYTFRDYVVRAFNSDKPYDQFVVEQLAADLLDLNDNRDLAAMGFLTVGRRYRNQQLDVDDRIDTTTRGFLGLTVACARCHDHKYDAIPTKDYYSLYGVFASSRVPADQDLPLIGTPENTPFYGEFKSKLDDLEGKLAAYDKMRAEKFTYDFRRQIVDYLVRALAVVSDEQASELDFLVVQSQFIRKGLVTKWRQFLAEKAADDDPILGVMKQLVLLPDAQFADQRESIYQKLEGANAGIENGMVNPLLLDRLIEAKPQNKVDLARLFGELLQQVFLKSIEDGAELTAAELQLLKLVSEDGTPTHVTVENVTAFYNRDDNNKRRKFTQPIDEHKSFARGNPPRAMVLSENPNPYDPRVFIRGQASRKGDHVPRQFLYAVSGKTREPFTEGSGRLEMAKAIVDPANTLTARVFVNRVWMHHFGKPLVNTPSDFGVRSDRPLQMAVLDYLADSFVRSGWSIKSLHREILLSSTYRQQSSTHEDGDTIDFENGLYWRANSRRLEYEALRDALIQALGELDLTMGGPSEDLTNSSTIRRRALYTFVDRQDLPGLLRVFDFPNPDAHNARRPSTTVPQQALFLMNSPVVIDRVRNWVASEKVQNLDAEQRINYFYQRFFQRAPNTTEVQIGMDFISSPEPVSKENNLNVWGQYAQLLLLTNEFSFID